MRGQYRPCLYLCKHRLFDHYRLSLYRSVMSKTKLPKPENVALGASIRAAREAASLDQITFAAAVGVKQQSVQQWESGQTAPKAGSLARISLALPSFNLMPAHATFMRVAENAAPAYIVRRKVPLISYVQAGEWSDAADPYLLGDGTEWIDTTRPVSSSSFALTVKGDSMLPEFKEGDVIVVDPTRRPSPGQFVVAKNSHDEAIFKKYRPRGLNDLGEHVFELVPLNDDYPTLYSDREPVTIIGVVVEGHKCYV